MANEPTPTKQTQSTPRWRWITNNASMRIFPLPPVWSEQAKSSTPDPDPLALRPGAQLVDAKRWELLKAKDPAGAKAKGNDEVEAGAGEIARLLTTKIPNATHRNRQAEGAGLPYLVEGPHVANKIAPLDGVPDAEAVELVEHMIDEGLVRACLQVERRPAVNEALHRVLDGLTKGIAQAVA